MHDLLRPTTNGSCSPVLRGRAHTLAVAYRWVVMPLARRPRQVERLFRSDIETIKTFCRLAQPEHLPMIKEIEKQVGGWGSQ